VRTKIPHVRGDWGVLVPFVAKTVQAALSTSFSQLQRNLHQCLLHSSSSSLSSYAVHDVHHVPCSRSFPLPSKRNFTRIAKTRCFCTATVVFAHRVSTVFSDFSPTRSSSSLHFSSRGVSFCPPVAHMPNIVGVLPNAISMQIQRCY
jgi:hypothetical protein